MDRYEFDGTLVRCDFDYFRYSLKEYIVTVLLTILVVVWAISGIALVILVLMHSGKGTGLSEAFSGIQSSVGTGIIEKNLTRMTIVAASIFVLSLVGMMLAWPI